MKLQDLCTKIDSFLTENPDYFVFKIGKTDDIEARQEAPEYKGYRLWHLLNGTPKEVSDAEIYLINYFMKTSTHKNKCQNNRSGGGSDEADKVYIAVKKENFTINDVCKDETMIDKNLPTNIEL